MNPAGRGRPLRFVGTVGLGWIGLRFALLWQATDPAIRPPSSTFLPRAFVPKPVVAARLRTAFLAAPAPSVSRHVGAGRSPPRPPTDSVVIASAMISRAQPAAPASRSFAATPSPFFPAVPAVPAAPPSQRRWQGSTWLALRPGRGIGAAPAAGQLGGSQYGVRLAYTLGSGVAAFGRLAGPLRGRGAEAALGLEWRPGAAPVRIAIEERFGLDGVRGGPGIGVVGGIDRDLAGFRLEAYGQAGMIARNRAEPYADGALRLTRLAAQRRARALRIGVGAWGAAQRGVQRFDIGPTLVASLPIGALDARVTLDWRQRIAGDARPGSGAALTLGSDF